MKGRKNRTIANAASTAVLGLSMILVCAAFPAVLAAGPMTPWLDQNSQDGSQSYSGVFSNIYFYPPNQINPGEVGEAVTQLANGNIFAVGLDSNIPNSCGAYGSAWILILTPSGGNAVTQILYGDCVDEAWLNFVIPVSDGGAFASGLDYTSQGLNPGWFGKFSDSGKVVWQGRLVGPVLTQFAPIELPDGSFFGAGSAQPATLVNSYALTLHISPQGGLLSYSTYKETANSFPGAIEGGELHLNSSAAALDGNQVFSGVVSTYFTNVGYGWAFVAGRTVVDGIPTFKVYYGHEWSSDAPGQSNYRILPTSDGNFVLTGLVRGIRYPYQACFLFAKLDAQLNLINPSLGYCGKPWIYGSWGYDAAPVNDRYGRGFILSGSSGDDPGYHDPGQLIRVDEDGNILWQTGQTGENSGDDVIWNGVSQVRGIAGIGFATAGYSYVGSDSYGGPGFGVATTDAQGRIGSCECWHTTQLVPVTLDLQSYDAKFRVENLPMQVVPSPLTPRTTSISPERLYQPALP